MKPSDLIAAVGRVDAVFAALLTASGITNAEYEQVKAGAVVSTCRFCGAEVLHGPKTGRRSHMKFCSDRCRVGSARRRAKEMSA